MINLLPVGLTLSLKSRDSAAHVAPCPFVQEFPSSYGECFAIHVSWLEPGQAGLAEVGPLFLLSWVAQVGVFLSPQKYLRVQKQTGKPIAPWVPQPERSRSLPYPGLAPTSGQMERYVHWGPCALRFSIPFDVSSLSLGLFVSYLSFPCIKLRLGKLLKPIFLKATMYENMES